MTSHCRHMTEGRASVRLRSVLESYDILSIQLHVALPDDEPAENRYGLAFECLLFERRRKRSLSTSPGIRRSVREDLRIRSAVGSKKAQLIGSSTVSSGALIAMAARSSPNALGLSRDIEPLWWEKITICCKRVTSSKRARRLKNECISATALRALSAM
jgi:hypothetical protein